MATLHARTNAVQQARRAAVLFFALFCGACSEPQEAPTAPPEATRLQPTPLVLDSGAFANLTDHELLIAVLTKLHALEARVEQESKLARVQLDSAVQAVGGALRLASTGAAGTAGPAAALSNQGSFSVQASLCGQYEFAADTKIESALSLWGGGEGMLGVDAYGNGAKGLVRGFATADTKVIPGGGAKLALQVCGQFTPVNLTRAPRLASDNLGAVAAVASAGAAESLLRNAVQAVPVDQLAGAASTLRMDGSRLGTAVHAVSSFSLADLPFGGGGALALVNALPLPIDIANLLNNPAGILQRAPEAALFAVNKLCDQTLFSGPLAQRAQQACSLRDQMPTGTALSGLLQGLQTLPANLGSLQSGLSSACGAINAMLPARVSIPPWDVTFPLGIGTVRTFSGYSQDVFSGVGRAC